MKSALVSIALALGAYLLGYNRGYDQGYDQAQKDTSKEINEAHRVARSYQTLAEEFYRPDPEAGTIKCGTYKFRRPPLEDHLP